MANFPFVIGDALQIGTATITATGNAVVLPTGTQVGSTAVATSTEVATGGGPKITNLQVIDNSFQVLDDTAVDITGGYIKITGTNFTSGCIVYIGLVPATATSFVSATEVRAQLAATAAGTYPVYLVNPDGGVAIRVPGVTFSASPSWQTASALSDQYDGAPLTLALVASDATSYTLVSGALPPGLSLNTSTGAITGTITGVTVDTVYTFTVRATDAQNQDSPRTFTVNVAVSDTYFRFTTLLLSGSAIPANTVIRDSSANNFNLTVFGDARASNFTPYGTGWSVYFDGTGDYLGFGSNNPLPATGDFTFECWIYLTSLPGVQAAIIGNQNQSNRYMLWVTNTGSVSIQVGPSFSRGTGNNAVATNKWYHIATTRTGTTHNLFIDGVAPSLTTSGSSPASIDNTEFFIGINYNSTYALTGYISNFRVVSQILYSTTFTPPTQPLTAITNTSLLTCHANRFLDSSTNNFAITRNGDARVVSFNPFNITNTGVNGSMYFDGTGDYLSAAYNSAFDLGSSNFTLEAWLYTSDSSSNFPSIVGRWQGSGTACWDLRPRSIERGNFLVFVYSTDGTTAAFVDSNGPALSDNAWHHVVAVRSGNNFALFVDGTRRNTANLSGVTIFNSASAPLNVGYDPWGTTYFTGYLSNVRVVKGTAVYDPTLTTLTVPTAPLTAIANTQLLTLQYDQPHNNHTFLDSSSNQFLITRSGNASQGTFSPFSQSGWSYYFNGTASASQAILTPTNAQYAIGTGQFSIEAWVYVQFKSTGSGNSIHSIISQGNNANNLMWGLSIIDSTNYISWGLTGSGITLSAYPVTKNTWNHIVVTRNASNEERIFLNGTLINLRTNTTNYSNASSTQIQIGTSYDTNYPGVYGVSSYGNTFSGYISQLRLDIGGIPGAYQTSSTTVGQNIFTPATTSVIATSNTKLLIGQDNRFKDNSTINAVLTPNGNTSVVAFSPFAPTAVYSPAVHGGSAYFDGSGDYLYLNDVDIFNFDTKPFTVECWVYPTASVATGYYYVISKWRSAPNKEIIFGLASNNGTWSYVYTTDGGTDKFITDPTAIVPYCWTHYAVSRTANTISLFRNGVRVATSTETGSLYNTSGYGITIAAHEHDRGSNFPGYVAGLRAVRGTAVYDPTQTTITVPTAPLTATTNTSLLLNFTDAAILDSTGRQVFETVADAKTSSVVTKFTGGSMSFDGTGDFLNLVPTSQLFNFNGVQFTVELWVYPTAAPSADYTGIIQSQQGTNSWVPYFSIQLMINLRVNLALNGANNTTTQTISLNTWTHLAVSRNSSGVVTLYINGVASSVAVTVDLASINLSWWVGKVDNSPGGGNYLYYFTGYIQDLRITRGYARYTANFTAPTAPARLK